MKHGTENEIHGIATLASLYMPAFMPQCCQYIGDGANFLNGKEQTWLLFSTHGHLKCKKHNCDEMCNSDLNVLHENMIVEVKCPYPNPLTVPVHYILPVRYVTQILVGMKCNGYQNVYTFHTPKKVQHSCNVSSIKCKE